MAQKLRIDEIEATSATQVRVKIDGGTVEEYAQGMKNGAIMPPVVVFAEKGSDRYILADGFHRVIGATDAGKKHIEATIKRGGMRQALLYALGANSDHGLPRSNADKRHAVQMALKDPEISRLTYREVGDICRVSHQLVKNIKEQQNLGKKGKKKKKAKAEKNNPGKNNRQSRPEPSQEEVDRDELRDAMQMIKAFPYGGDEAVKLKLTQVDRRNLIYCANWLATAVEFVT